MGKSSRRRHYRCALYVKLLIDNRMSHLVYYLLFDTGGVAGLILLCLMLRMMQRRRFARAHPGAQPNFFAGKPMFGGPWGHSNAPVSPQPASQFNNGGPGYSNYNPSNSFHSPQNALQSPALAANPEYPAPNGPLPPPAYGQDANYEGKYAPVSSYHYQYLYHSQPHSYGKCSSEC